MYIEATMSIKPNLGMLWDPVSYPQSIKMRLEVPAI